MNMQARAGLLDQLREHACEFGAQACWANHAGVIEFFRHRGLGAPGTWISWVNAVVLESIARGIALALVPEADDYANPGARAWAQYLLERQRGELVETTTHAHAWSRAKRIATGYAVQVASTRCGLEPTITERRFLTAARLYNWSMAHREPLDALIEFSGVLHPAFAALTIDPAAVDRLFEVGDAAVAEKACHIAWDAAELESLALSNLMSLLPRVLALFAPEAGRS